MSDPVNAPRSKQAYQFPNRSEADHCFKSMLTFARESPELWPTDVLALWTAAMEEATRLRERVNAFEASSRKATEGMEAPSV